MIQYDENDPVFQRLADADECFDLDFVVFVCIILFLIFVMFS